MRDRSEDRCELLRAEILRLLDCASEKELKCAYQFLLHLIK